MSLPYLPVTHALAAFYGWRCDHGKHRDEACSECVASDAFDRKFRPKLYARRYPAREPTNENGWTAQWKRR